MDEQFKQRLNDYFDPYDLVELLGITIEEVIEAFSEKIEANDDMLKDYMNYGD